MSAENTPSLSAAIFDCLDKFNFDRVHKGMVAVDWKWASSGPPEVPTIEQLHSQASRLLWEAALRTDPVDLAAGIASVVSTGGLEASYRLRHGRATVTLKFVLVENYCDCLPEASQRV